MAREIIIYTDESEQRGRHFSNFYDAALVWSHHMPKVSQDLTSAIAQLGLTGEVKWTSVTPSVLERYEAFADRVFDLVKARRLRLRIMFTQNLIQAKGLSPHHRENRYHILYYQFIKHGLGLRYANSTQEIVRARLYVDQMPSTKEKNANFKAYVSNLSRSPEFRQARIMIPRDQIAEVRSHDHVVMQALDLVLGAVAFRLNDRHKEKPEGARRRGKRTRAKEQLYKHIHQRICQLRP